MAARSIIGGGLEGLGRALMRREDIERQDQLIAGERARENELMTRQETRQDALITRQEAREDLMMQRQEAIARAAQIREGFVRGQEREEDRNFQSELADRQMDHQSRLAGDENALMARRMDHEDRRAVREQASTQLAALDNRIMELQDMALKGEVLGSEGEVERQIAEAEQQKIGVRSWMIESLYEMDDPQYKGMPGDQRLAAMGYSKDQILRFQRLGEKVGGEAPTEEAPAASAPAGRSDAQIGNDLAVAEASTGRSGGLAAQERKTLGMPAQSSASEPAMAAPEQLPASPEILPDMSQAGRGRRRPPPPPDIGAALREIFPAQEGRKARGAKGPEEAAPAKKPDPKMADGLRQAHDELLKPYGGDIEKAPKHVRQLVEALRLQLRDFDE